MGYEPPPPRSALTLRIVLASFGLVLWIAAAVLAALLELPVGWVIAFAVLGVVALVDLVIVARRKRSESG
ncbi:DUF6343 family protein [Kribbella speibonae]|uniref:DUF2530 domain-containing protein n=1 Tax=Kribbella speibonae TaxID=1572660 RepID=A0ABY1ZYE3_9ACTN|nr:DUF6343 family protein [Kribbella speibonae]TCC17412.1 hypothetical protein E0H58_37220 [Kribbella speibonae]